MITAAAVLLASPLTACSSQPQACKELAPAAESFHTAALAFDVDRTDSTVASLYLSTLKDLGRTALEVSDTSSAREEGLSDDLRDFASMVAQAESDSQAAGVAALIASGISEKCGFEIYPKSDSTS